MYPDVIQRCRELGWIHSFGRNERADKNPKDRRTGDEIRAKFNRNYDYHGRRLKRLSVSAEI